MSCEAPFWEDIYVIFNNFSLQYKPTCKHSSFNFAARLVLLSLFVGMIASILGGLSAFVVTLMFGIITAVIIIFTTKMDEDDDDDDERGERDEGERGERGERGREREKKYISGYHKLPYVANVDPSGYLSPMEGFTSGSINSSINGGSIPGSIQGVMEVDAFPYCGPMLPEYTPPVARNLFMNVLLDEIKYNPDRPGAAPVNNTTVKQTLDDYFRVNWFSDPTDVFGKNQSQRQFVTQPSTTVPNNQGAFADWLYRIPGKTCKEGGREACLSGTDSGSIPWLNQAS